MSSKTTGIDQIRQRLERWELEHLRALAAGLAERLEQTETALEAARAQIDAAWRDADMWRDQVIELVDDLQAIGRTVGLTQSGQLVTMPASDGVDIDGVHAERGAA